MSSSGAEAKQASIGDGKDAKEAERKTRIVKSTDFWPIYRYQQMTYNPMASGNFVERYTRCPRYADAYTYMVAFSERKMPYEEPNVRVRDFKDAFFVSSGHLDLQHSELAGIFGGREEWCELWSPSQFDYYGSWGPHGTFQGYLLANGDFIDVSKMKTAFSKTGYPFRASKGVVHFTRLTGDSENDPNKCGVEVYV